jgi:RNA polymerase primary sigma factor
MFVSGKLKPEQMKKSIEITKRESEAVDKYFQEIRKFSPLSAGEEANLARLIHEGCEESYARLIKANLRFVVMVAKRYQHCKVPLLDLISAGNIGLFSAIPRFDETLGNKFISYAKRSVRQSIISAISEHSRIVRLPENQLKRLYKIQKAADSLMQKLEREPTDDEIAEETGLTWEEVDEAKQNKFHYKWMDAPAAAEGEDGDWHDIMPDESSLSIESQLLNKELQKLIQTILPTLKKREPELINLSFGLNGGKEMTLDEIGDEYKITPDRARQGIDTAIRRLRDPSRSNLLKPYLQSY